MYGDAAISFGGSIVAGGLDIDEFHTYRFESLNGSHFWLSVDGLVFIDDVDNQGNEYHYLQFGGVGGCPSDQIPDMTNEWDSIRFGTIAFGERIIATDPPAGYLDPGQHTGMDRFAVTFDSANYVYIDDITVEVTGGVAPGIDWTRRRENDEPDTLEIVLDGPIPDGELTRFIFDDGQVVNVVEYTFVTVNQGACCTGEGACVDLTPAGCAAITGAEYKGDGTACLGDSSGNGTDDACDLGACCLPAGTCTVTDPADCAATEGGEYRGDDTICEGDHNGNDIDDACEPPIPTVSQWGMAIMTLLLLTAATAIIKQPEGG